MTISRVVVDKSAERGFRRRALRHLPKEYIEAIFGYVQDRTAHVCIFAPFPHTATSKAIYYDEEEAADDCSAEAKEHRLQHIGSIHSHPRRDDAMFSETDLQERRRDLHDLVMGICAIEIHRKAGKTRRRCRIAYWPGVLPLDLDYVDWAKGKEVA